MPGPQHDPPPPPASWPLSNGRLRQLAEHPVGKLLERAFIALVAFLAVWQFNTLNDMRDRLGEMRGDALAAMVRIERAERDIQALWNRRGGDPWQREMNR